MCKYSLGGKELSFWKWYYGKSYLLRMRSDSFLIVIDKETGEYHNFYATDEPGAKELLKEIAKCMKKHPAIIDDEDKE